MQPDKPEKPDPMDEIDVELEDQPAPRPQHSKYPGKKPGGGNKKKIIIIVLIVVVVLALAGAAYWWFALRDNGDQQENQPQATQQQEERARETPDLSPQEASQKVGFNSDTLNLEFTHRRDWTVSESDDKSVITVSSPPVGYQTANGSVPESQGVFTLKISVGVNDDQSQTINNAVAVKASEVIAYDNPTDEQRFYTNLSYGGEEDNFNFLLVTGSVEYQPGDPFASGQLALNNSFYLIGGGYGEDPDDAFGFDAVPVTQINNQVVEQAVAIIKSLKIN